MSEQKKQRTDPSAKQTGDFSKSKQSKQADSSLWPPVIYRFEYRLENVYVQRRFPSVHAYRQERVRLKAVQREKLRSRTAGRARKAFLSSQIARTHVLHTAGSEFHEGDTDYAADLLLGCIAAAGGIATVAAAIGLRSSDLEEQLEIDETLHPDVAAPLLYALARWPQ